MVQRGVVDRPSSSGLADVLELILDKGLVIDAYVRVSLIGIELLTIDARVVVASVDTYLRFAEAVSRLDLTQTQVHSLSELVEGTTRAGSRGKLTGAVDAVMDKLSELAEPQHDGQRQRRGGNS